MTFMVIMDSFRVVMFACFLVATLWFFVLAWLSRNAHRDDDIVQRHFLEHAVASLFLFLGSIVGTVWSFAHLFSKQQDELLEIPFTVAFSLLLIGAILFMIHMIKEQTPGHDFYIRETGGDLWQAKKN